MQNDYKFVLRVALVQVEKLKELAKLQKRSLNSEINIAIENHIKSVRNDENKNR